MLTLKTSFEQGFPGTNGTKPIPFVCSHKSSPNPVPVKYEAGKFYQGKRAQPAQLDGETSLW